jgi:hypothetical protein
LISLPTATKEAMQQHMQQMQQMQSMQIRAMIQRSKNVGMMNIANAMLWSARMTANAVHNGQMSQMAAQMPYGYDYVYNDSPGIW